MNRNRRTNWEAIPRSATVVGNPSVAVRDRLHYDSLKTAKYMTGNATVSMNLQSERTWNHHFWCNDPLLSRSLTKDDNVGHATFEIGKTITSATDKQLLTSFRARHPHAAFDDR